ncbi:MAG: HEAT repeat domain-containing protein, partial [Fibrobacterota bacterium]
MALSAKPLYGAAGLLWFASAALLCVHGWPRNGVFLFALLHAGSVTALFAAFLLEGRPGTRLWNGKAALLALCLPLFGLPVYWIVSRRPAHAGGPGALRDYEDHVKYRRPAADAANADADSNARLYSERVNLPPFLDVLYSPGNAAEKIRTLHAMAKLPGRDTVEGIRSALNDPAAEVRFAAVSALKKIEAPILRDIQQWSEQLRKRPDDADTLVNLGNLYYNYCYMGLLDKVNALHYAGLALSAYERAHALAPGRTDLWLSMGKVRLLISDTP